MEQNAFYHRLIWCKCGVILVGYDYERKFPVSKFNEENELGSYKKIELCK